MDDQKKNQVHESHVVQPFVPQGSQTIVRQPSVPQQKDFDKKGDVPIRSGSQSTTSSEQSLTPSPAPLVQKQEKKTHGHKHPGIIYCTRTQLFFYVEGFPTITIYPYPAAVVRDLDVIDKTLFSGQIIDLLRKNNIPPANFYLLFSNATLFARQVISSDPLQKKIEEEAFLNTVPFEIPSTQHVVMGQSTYIVAANKQLYEAIQETLEPKGFEISLILPEFLFTKEINLSQGLTAASGTHLIKSMQNFRQFNFLKKESPYTGTDQKENDGKLQLQVKGGKSNRVFVLIGVFFMLIGVLVAVFLWTQQQNTPVPPVKPPAIAQPEISETPAAVVASDEAALASPSAVQQGEVQGVTSPSILINYSPANTRQADHLRAKFLQMGFQSVQMQSIVIQSSTTRLTFLSTVPVQLRDVILTEIKNIYSSLSSVETDRGVTDIVITLQNF